MNLQRYLQAQTKTTITLFAVGLTLLVSGVDLLTGPLAFSIFYLIPVSLAAWFAGKWIGNGLAVVIAIAWFIFGTYLTATPHTLSANIWNSAAQCGFLLVVVLLVAKLKALHDNLERQIAERTSNLSEAIAKRQKADTNAANAALFPEEDPAPILRANRDGKLLYANRAAADLLTLWHCKLTALVPEPVREVITATLASGQSSELEVSCGARSLSFIFVPIGERGYVNLYGRDVTDRKQLEANAKLQFAQLATDKMLDAAYWIYPDGRIVYVNDAACRQLGYTRTELLALNISDLDPDMSPERWAQRWRDNKIAKHRVFETRHRAKDGRVVPVELTVSHLENAGNEYHFSITRDLTARRQAEAALREEQEKMALAVAGSDGASWDIPLDPTRPDFVPDKMIVSPRVKEFIGFRDDEFPDSLAAWYDRIHPDDVAAARASADAKGVEYRIRHKDGTWRWIISHGRLFRDSQGRPVHWAGINWDITDRKRTEADLERLVQERTQTLQITQQRLQNIYNSSQDVIAYTDLDGRLMDFNHAFETLTGYSAAELQQMTFFQLTSPEFIDQSRRMIAELIRTGVPARYENDYYRKDGTRVPVAITVWGVRDQTGQVIGLAGIVRDVTEQHQLQQQLLEISDHERQRISQDLHDGICQLLTASTFAIGALEERLTAAGEPGAHAAHEIGELIRRANAETRGVAHGLHPAELDAGGLPAALRQLANNVALSGKVTCELDCPATLSSLGNTRVMHIYRIAQEAVANALRHGEPSHIDITLSVTADVIQLQVANNGRDLAVNASGQSGMGLNIMAYRARVIGGVLQVNRGVAGGTVVNLVLPAEIAHEKS